MFNIQYIAGALALFFITLAVSKWLSRSAHKKASEAKSLAQSHVGQNSNVSLHNPYPNGAPIPEAPKPSDEKPQPPPSPAPAQQPAPVQVQTAPPANVPAAPKPAPAPAAPAAPASPEQIYKWN